MLARRLTIVQGWRRPPATVEDANVRRLIVQTAFAGVIQGGIVAFLPVMLARMGASGLTVSALNAGLALTSIIMALPSGPIVERQRKLVAWSARYFLLVRVCYVLIALAAFLSVEIAPILCVAFWALSGIPAALANNAWYGVLAGAVSPRRRPVVNGARWALLGFVSAICVAAFGRGLDLLPFPLGYQAVFVLSAIAGLAQMHWYGRIEIPDREPGPQASSYGLRQVVDSIVGPLREGGEFLHYTIGTSVLRLGLHLPIGLFSLFWVNDLHASDTWIGLRSTVGNIALTVGYYAWGRMTAKLGHRRTLGFASLGLSLYPALTAASPTVEWLLPAALIWGLFASGIDMSLFEGLLDVCPADRRAEFVAVNTFVANLIAFVAPIAGAWLSELTSIRFVLALAAGLHLAAVAAVVILAMRKHAVSGTPDPVV